MNYLNFDPCQDLTCFPEEQVDQFEHIEMSPIAWTFSVAGCTEEEVETLMTVEIARMQGLLFALALDAKKDGHNACFITDGVRGTRDGDVMAISIILGFGDVSEYRRPVLLDLSHVRPQTIATPPPTVNPHHMAQGRKGRR